MKTVYRPGLYLLTAIGLMVWLFGSRSSGFDTPAAKRKLAVKKRESRQRANDTARHLCEKPAEKTPPPGSEQAVKAFMRAKLTAMRHILDGLATEDYEQIRKSAEKMRAMSTQVEWNIVQGPIYGEYSAAFRRNADLLSKAAREKNIEGAALIYMNLTMNCINCHRFNREREKTGFFPGD